MDYTRHITEDQDKTRQKGNQTRAAKAAAQKEYNEAHKEVKGSIRADKKGHIDNLARAAEEAPAQRNPKGLYDITRKLPGRYQQTDKPVNDKQG